MKSNVSMYDFERAFSDMGRQDQFSYEGKRALFEWLEDLSDDTGTEYELDVIALCCEFTEYDNLENFHADYDAEDYPDYETISDHTTIIQPKYYLYTATGENWGDHPFIIQQF